VKQDGAYRVPSATNLTGGDENRLYVNLFGGGFIQKHHPQPGGINVWGERGFA